VTKLLSTLVGGARLELATNGLKVQVHGKVVIRHIYATTTKFVGPFQMNKRESST